MLLLSSGYVMAQERFEPDVVPADNPVTLTEAGVSNGIAFKLQLNNFGFGVGGQYRRVLGPMTEGVIELQITSLKDETEQSFNFWGTQIIPNKYSRVLTAPMLIGVKHRLFAQPLSDNFRVFVQGMAGPSLAFVYPYFDDIEGGYRHPNQLPYDIFQGWGEGFFTWGTSGHMSMGVDFGDNFSRIQTIQFGYSFYYYPDGIQLLEPESFDGRGGSGPQYYFGSPQITFVFGNMW